MNFVERITVLKHRLADLAAAIEVIPRKRAEFSLAAAEGDTAAAAAIDRLDGEGTSLIREQATVLEAIDQIEAKLAEAAAEKAAEAQQRQAAVAQKLAATIMSTDAEIDASLVSLRQTFERRRDLLRELGAALPSHLTNRLTGKACATAAARAARLNEFLAIEHTGPAQTLSLADAGKPALTALAKPSPTNGGGKL